MIGVFAVYGDEIYFSETVQKANLQPCEIPLELWSTDTGLFIPFTSHSMAVLDVLRDSKDTFHTAVDLPAICGIFIDAKTRVYEVGVVDEKLRLRRVPTGPGVLYTRALHRDMEEAMFAALRLTRDLKKAVELAGRSIVCIAGKPVFTTVQIVSWAVFKNDPRLIRTMTTPKLKRLVETMLKEEAQKKKDTAA